MGKDSRDLPGQALLDAAWFDPIEVMIQDQVRGFIENLVEAELDDALGRSRYQRPGTANVASSTAGYRHGRRARQLLGSFGAVTIQVPRARLNDGHGTSREWRSEALPRYARMTRQVEALIAGTYLSGTNTRRVRRALGALFKGAVGKDVVSRTWRKVQTDWQAWCRRSLADEDVVRLILDGTVVRVRLDGKATSISLLVALGIRRDGQKVLLAVRNMGGESEAAWRGLLDDLVSRGCKYRASSSSMVRRDWRRPLAWCGPRHWSSGAPYTNTATSWLMLQNDCMRKSRPTTTT
jgi:transposase-like protein